MMKDVTAVVIIYMRDCVVVLSSETTTRRTIIPFQILPVVRHPAP